MWVAALTSKPRRPQVALKSSDPILVFFSLMHADQVAVMQFLHKEHGLNPNPSNKHGLPASCMYFPMLRQFFQALFFFLLFLWKF